MNYSLASHQKRSRNLTLFSPIARSCILFVLIILFATRVQAQVPSRTFADFEAGSLDGWTIEGDAFGSAPATSASYEGQVRGFGGSQYLSSLHKRKGNAATGRAVSQTFTVVKPYITFRIGGGSHPNQACINLVLDGKVVRTETGGDSPQLLSRTWEVSEFVGKSAHFEVVDATDSAERGYILVDDIAFIGPDLVITPALSENALVIEIPARVIQILDSQGDNRFADGSREILSAASVEKHMSALNEIYSPAKVRFTFNPKEFETRRDDYLYTDFDTPGEKVQIDDRESKPPQTGREERMRAFQKVADERSDRLTVIVHRGSDWRWNARTQKWIYSAGYSRGRPKPRGANQGHYIRVTSMIPKIWAHELGHAFGLGHTSRDTADYPSNLVNEALISTACQEYVAKVGSDKHFEHPIDGDYASGVTDTPPNPGIGFWENTQDRTRMIMLHLTGKDPVCLFVTRDNVMASSSGNDRFTNDQIRLMRRWAGVWQRKK